MAIPKVIKNFNLIVDGQGFAGLVDEVALPDLEITTEEHRAGGMDAPAALDLGMELLEMGFTMAEHSPVVFRQFGLINQAAVVLTFRAAKVDDTVVLPYVINARGMYQQLQLGDVSNGQKNPLEATLNLRYLRIELAGALLVEIDVDNMVRIINGVDQLELQRRALGL